MKGILNSDIFSKSAVTRDCTDLTVKSPSLVLGHVYDITMIAAQVIQVPGGDEIGVVGDVRVPGFASASKS